MKEAMDTIRMHKEEPTSKFYSRPKMLWSRYVKTAHSHWAGEEF